MSHIRPSRWFYYVPPSPVEICGNGIDVFLSQSYYGTHVLYDLRGLCGLVGWWTGLDGSAKARAWTCSPVADQDPLLDAFDFIPGVRLGLE